MDGRAPHRFVRGIAATLPAFLCISLASCWALFEEEAENANEFALITLLQIDFCNQLRFTPVPGEAEAIYLTLAGGGYVVGGAAAPALVATADGSSFEARTPPPGEVRSLSVIQPDNLYAIAGARSEPVYSTDGGLNWLYFASDTDFGFYRSSDLRYVDIRFYDANNGFRAGYDSSFRYALERTTDGGSSWQRFVHENTSSIDGVLRAGEVLPSGRTFFYASSQDGIAVFDSTDGGAALQLRGEALEPDGGFKRLHFLDDSRGWVYGEADYFESVDGGANWSARSNEIATSLILALQFHSASVGYAAVGEGGADGTAFGVWKTADGGVSFSLLRSGLQRGVKRPALQVTGDGRLYVSDGNAILATDDDFASERLLQPGLTDLRVDGTGRDLNPAFCSTPAALLAELL